MKMVEHRWVHVIWCDDVRHEVGNKPSFMGVYGADIVLAKLPTTLGRLAAHIQIGTPKNRLFGNIKVRLMRNDADESVAEIVVASEDLTVMNEQISSNGVQDTDSEESKQSSITFAFLVMLGPLDLNETTKWLKVFVDTEDETLESFKLRIKVNADSAARLH